MGALGNNTDAAGRDAMLAAIQTSMRRIEQENEAHRDEIDRLKRRWIDTGDPVPPVPNLPFNPSPAPPNSNPKPTVAPLDAEAALAILNQVEIDPSNAVDIDVVPEIVTKCISYATITAEMVWAYVCPNDVTDGFNVQPNLDGSTRFTTTTVSTRKIGTHFELQTVIVKVIASVYTVHPDMGAKTSPSCPRPPRKPACATASNSPRPCSTSIEF